MDILWMFHPTVAGFTRFVNLHIYQVGTVKEQKQRQ